MDTLVDVSDYDVYQAPGDASGEQPASDQQWQVLIEYSNKGEAKPPTLVHVFPGVYATHDEAIAEAARVAVDHRPPDPFSPRGRTVYRDADGFLSVIEGAMTTFHFSTRVVRLVGTADS